MILNSKLFGFLQQILIFWPSFTFFGHCVVSVVCGNYKDGEVSKDLYFPNKLFVSSMGKSLGVSTKIDAQSFLVDQKVPVHGFTQIDALMQIVVSTKCKEH